MTEVTTYGPGGLDPTKPASNVVSTQTVAEPPERTNADALLQRAQQALAANAAFLALGAPTNAQVLAQTQRLTREASGLIRLALAQYDSVADS